MERVRKSALCAAITLVSCFTIISPAAAADGADLFNSKCAMCHPGGGNRANPGKPVTGSQYLQTKEIFKQFLAKKNGLMPPFKAISEDDEALSALYGYCRKLR